MNGFRAMALAVLLLPTFVSAADDPLAGVREKIVGHQHKDAREQLLKARDVFAARKDPAGEALAWLLLGVTDTALENGVAARSEIETATEKFVALGDHFSAAVGLIALATFDKSEDRLTDAMATYERALAMLRRAAEPDSRFSLDTLKAIGPTSGMSFEMLGPMASFPEMLKPIALQAMEFMTRDAYAVTLMEAGELEKAETQLTQANSVMGPWAGFLNITVDAHFGDLRRRQWRLDEARESYLKALRGSDIVRVFTGSSDEELSVLGKLAELELLAGRVEEALAWNDRALKNVRAAMNAKRERAILENRAKLLGKAGRYDEAFALYEDVLAQAMESNDVFREASVHADLGTLHMFRGSFGSAARHLEKAIELYQGLGATFIESPMWILLAQVQMQLDMQDDAALALDNACALASRSGFRLASAMVDVMRNAKAVMAGGGSIDEIGKVLESITESREAKALMMGEIPLQAIRDPLGLELPTTGTPGPSSAGRDGVLMLQAMPLFIKGKTLFDRGDREGARAVLQQALQTNPNSDIRAGLLAFIGASYRVDGKLDDAIRYVTQAVDVMEVTAGNIKVEEMLAGYLGGTRRAYYSVLIDFLVEAHRSEDAFAQAERARTRAFLQMVGNHRLNTAHAAEPHLVREAEILRAEIATREREAELGQGEIAARLNADLERARQRYRNVLTRVKVSNPEYESLMSVEPLRIEEIRKELEPGTTLISYYVSLKVVHAWVLDRESAHHVVLPVDKAGLQQILCWTAQFGQPVDARGVRLTDACGAGATPEEAFDRLMAPLLDSIRHRKLVIVPHGVLHYVPFVALRNRRTERYLIDDYALTYAPSASALRFLRAKESPVDGAALILGDPVSPMARLPGAAEEATAIANTLGAAPILGVAARESLLYDAHGRFDLVHLAAHGIYDPKNPLFSRIALSRDDAHDGSLTVDEILSSLDLTGVNLVVLSACQSAMGARSGGDEIVGLTRALLYAGTPGVISTLWNIDDAASAGLMKEFYRRLAAGATAADALREAQLATRENARYADPRYWAAFTLTGNPQGRWKRPE